MGAALGAIGVGLALWLLTADPEVAAPIGPAAASLGRVGVGDVRVLVSDERLDSSTIAVRVMISQRVSHATAQITTSPMPRFQ